MKATDKQRIEGMVGNDRMFHAVFFSCEDMSVGDEAAYFAASLLLKLEREKLSTSPVFFLLDGTQAKVADADELLTELQRHAFEGERRAVYIKNADSLSELIQNKLLKTLEEPRAGIYFLLCGNEDGLLPTVRSRVMKIRLSPPDVSDIDSKLCALGASKSQAEFSRTLGGGRFDMAERIFCNEDERKLYSASVGFVLNPDAALLMPFCQTKDAALHALDVLLLAYRDMLRLKETGKAAIFLHYSAKLSMAAASLHEKDICDIIDKILDARERVRMNASVRQTVFSLALYIKNR